MSNHKTIIRSAGIIGIATLCSRLLGFVRDVVIARLFGVYVYAQAFVIAFRIPNLFRDLVGEGAANAAFVPVFSKYSIQHSKEEFWGLANVVLNLLLVVLAAITLLGIVFAPLIVRLIAPGFSADPYKLETTVRLTRIVFPYILLISLTAYAVGILNSLKHFIVPAFAPCLLNISIIVFALLFGEGTRGLALGVLVGGILQLAIQLPVLYQKGFRLRLFAGYRHPEAKTIGLLMLPRLLSSSIYQVNNFVDSIFGSLASLVGEGGVAILYFAYRLIQFPLGIFTNALSQAILPTFSEQALQTSRDNLKHTLAFGLRAVFFVMLPASAGLMALAQPIVSGLFGGGRFDAYSTQLTSRVLFFYSIGLFAYGANKILQSCFFSLKDTFTPAKVSILSLVVNIALNAILMFPLKLAGLALATSLSGISTTLILFFILDTRLDRLDKKALFLSFLRILLASTAMAIVCSWVSGGVGIYGSVFHKLLGLAVLIATGIASYAAFCFFFGVTEIRELWHWLINKRKVKGFH